MTVSEFLLKLATDPELRKQFQADPQGVAAGHGLDEDAQKLLSAGDQGELRYEVHLDTEVQGETASILWIHVLPWLHFDAD